MIAVGLMSGTSLDGIDAALVETDGESLIFPGPSLTLAYPESLRELLLAAPTDPATVRDMTDHHAEAVDALMEKAGIDAGQVSVLGFSGQTVAHAPQEGWTWQTGDAGRLARASGIDVVTDFRSRDMAYGGEGAPLVPLFHRAVTTDIARPLAVLNVGGVANVTWIGRDGQLLAFDTGPGNGPLDDLMLRAEGLPCDRDGDRALAGCLDRQILECLLGDPWFGLLPPKSLDRRHFDNSCEEGTKTLSTENAAATLVGFVAEAVARGAKHFPDRPGRWIVAGGGRRNPAIMKALGEVLEGNIDPTEDVGLDGDSLEAQAFAWLAVRSLRGLPLTLPETTGVSAPMSGGVLVRKPGLSERV